MAIATASLLISGVAAFADTYTFALIPANGNIGGPAGSTIGWGYTITNNSATNFLDALAVNAGLFQHATLDSGDYFDFPLVAPNTTVTVSFVPADGSGFGAGLAALTWAANAPIGFTNSGNFDLSACWASSSGACITNAPDALAPYSASVTNVMPEPSAGATAILGILMLSVSVLTGKLTSRIRG